MEYICNWLWSRDWNQFFTVLGALATTAGCVIAVWIYRNWNTQKKYETIANEAARIFEEVYKLRDDVLTLHTYHAEPLKIAALGQKRDFLEQALTLMYQELSKLKSVRNNRTKAYTSSITDFIRDL